MPICSPDFYMIRLRGKLHELPDQRNLPQHFEKVHPDYGAGVRVAMDKLAQA